MDASRPRETHRSEGPRSSGPFQGPVLKLFRHELCSSATLGPVVPLLTARSCPHVVNAGNCPFGGSTINDVILAALRNDPSPQWAGGPVPSSTSAPTSVVFFTRS